jgi:hypothetical protein
MTWFGRNHTGRELFSWESQFIAALARLLMEIAASQVDESETALTAEGATCLIVLIPHRALGGISIVVWLFEDRGEVTWAQVADLDCCHDSLDLGISVGRFRFDRNRCDFSAILECIREQISEPLTLRVFDDHTATVLVRDRGGVLCKVGEVGTSSRRRGLSGRRTLTRETQIRFTDPSLPPIVQPSGVEDWFRQDEG